MSHADLDAQGRRMDCLDKAYCIRHFYSCPGLLRYLISFWPGAEARLRHDELFHELLSKLAQEASACVS